MSSISSKTHSVARMMSLSCQFSSKSFSDSSAACCSSSSVFLCDWKLLAFPASFFRVASSSSLDRGVLTPKDPNSSRLVLATSRERFFKGSALSIVVSSSGCATSSFSTSCVGTFSFSLNISMSTPPDSRSRSSRCLLASNSCCSCSLACRFSPVVALGLLFSRPKFQFPLVVSHSRNALKSACSGRTPNSFSFDNFRRNLLRWLLFLVLCEP